jgi:hypothetical protein
MIRLAFTAAGVSAAALALGACTPPHPHPQAALRAIASLDCPAAQGDLTRQSAASDGKSCLYADEEGSQVTLQLIDLNGQDPAAALAPVEAQLRSEMPVAVAAKAGASGTDSDRVDIDLPGVHIHANGKDNATVEAGGGAGGKSVAVTEGNGKTGYAAGKPGVSVFAGESGAEVRVNEPGSGIRRALILASDHPGPGGFKAVGYDARGPLGGPLVVAVLKAKAEDQRGLKGEMRDLLRLNVGG